MAKPQLTGNASDFLELGVASAGRGDLEAVEHLLKLRPKWLNERGSHGRSMLWEAAYRGRLEMVQALCDRGADLHAIGCHYTPCGGVEISPYCAAVFRKRHAVAEELLARGARRDIHTLAYLGEVEEVRGLLDRNPKLLEREMRQWPEEHPQPWTTPLVYGVARQHVDVVELLIERGAEVRAHSKMLLLHADEDVTIARLLLEAGADAAEAEPPQVSTDPYALLLAEYGVAAEIDRWDNMGWPELVYVCRGDRGGDPDEVTRLLGAGANVQVVNSKGKTALHVAAKAGFAPAATVLLKHGAKVDATDPQGETPLFDALRSTIKRTERLVEVIALLLQYGADPLHRNSEGSTPVDVAKALRRADADELRAALRRPRRA
ncbi:MAG: ankyrin repeat domain-containing protein [Planctomycetota bacterium]